MTWVTAENLCVVMWIRPECLPLTQVAYVNLMARDRRVSDIRNFGNSPVTLPRPNIKHEEREAGTSYDKG